MLFQQAGIFAVLENQREKIKRLVEKLEPNYLLNASEEDLAKALVEEVRLEVPVINESGIHTSDYGETDIDVSSDPVRRFLDRGRPSYVKGVRVTVAIPYEGDGQFFHVQPENVVWHDLGEVNISDSEVLLTYRRLGNDAAAVQRGYQSALQILRQNLASLKTSVDRFHVQIDGEIRQLLNERKAKLLANANMVEVLGLPIKRRQGVPTSYALPVKRRKPKIERPVVSRDKFRPEPALAMDEYEHILGIVKNMVAVMERSPKAFETLGEEDLRMHFLVQLNGQYEGDATGETFNYQGKTDILIRQENRNVFVAECKFWEGEKHFLETIDQLLSLYVGWRDTKIAVLLFSRNVGFTEVLQKVSTTAPQHPCFKRDLGKSDETSFRYLFHQPADRNREVILSVLVFDVPKPEKRPE
jgi:hypothetical protein